jgi:thioredoxin-like negative regulator of GroEL
MFGLLPVGEAIRWLEAMASDDSEVLLGFAEKQAEASRYRDAIAALRRANTLKPTDPQKARVDRLGKTIESRAKPAADAFLARIKSNADGSWVDGFLAYRDEFEFADAAREVMGAFESLRKRHEPLAQKAFGEARAAFQQGKPDQGYAKLQEIVDKDYAASLYRNIKEQLKSRK